VRYPPSDSTTGLQPSGLKPSDDTRRRTPTASALLVRDSRESADRSDAYLPHGGFIRSVLKTGDVACTELNS
jgi:hypothetical protein